MSEFYNKQEEKVQVINLFYIAKLYGIVWLLAA